jgi:NAD(P)-dependent dehydrogenase (short-subunit alcohol dehydrogenase family)
MTGTPATSPLLTTPLVGTTALVTGAAGGIGLAISAALIASGAQRVYGLDRVEAKGEGVEGIIIDLIDLDAVSSVIADLAVSPQIVVNAAGYYVWREGLDIANNDFRRTLDINVTAPFVIMREVSKRLEREQLAGAFINISSISGKRGFPNQADYVTSKGALISLTRAAALDLAPNITVNSIAPGTVNTPMIEQVAKDIAAKTGLSIEDQIAALIQQIPTQRMQEPNEIAAAVVFLASKAARSITGETLTVDGGISRD